MDAIVIKMKKIRVVHYSDSDEFVPLVRVPSGADEAGMFVYPASAAAPEADWPGRYRHEFLIDESLVDEVQTFEAGECGNEKRVVELFVPAAHLGALIPC